MSPTPRQSLGPTYLEGLSCPICGHEELSLKQMDRYPDYVACRNCESQFVVEEGGERVMYGKIPASYPRTQRFALQQWVWPEAIARRAGSERPEPSEGVSLDEPSEFEPEAERPSQAEEDEEARAEERPEPPVEEPAEMDFSAEAEEDWEPSVDFDVSPPAPSDAEEMDLSEPQFEEAEGFVDEEQAAEMMAEAPSEDEAPILPFDELEERAPSQEDLADFEPAPEMPDWLQAGAEGAAAVPDSEEPPAEEEEFGEGEDLLASLWADEEEEAEEEAPQADQAAAPEGAGALGGLAFDAEGAPEPEAEGAPEEDLWPEYEEEAISSPTPDEQEPGREEPGPEAAAQAMEPQEESGEPTEEELAEMYWTGQVADKAEAEPIPEPEPIEALESREPEEPEPGIRYRVVLDRSQARFPSELCAHCTQSPTVGTLTVTARIFQGAGLGERQVRSYRVPLCADCQARANARSEEQQTAQLQAHLISVLVALVLVVAGLALGLVDFQRSVILNLAILGLLAGMGYVVPAALLLIRASRYPKPEDATYVQTTLRVPADTEGTETAFEWRNRTYAQQFLAKNKENAVSKVNRIQEREYAGS